MLMVILYNVQTHLTNAFLEPLTPFEQHCA